MTAYDAIVIGTGQACLLDHLIRPLQERRWDRQAQGPGGLEVDHKVELSRLLDRQVTGLGALQNLVYEERPAPVHVEYKVPMNARRFINEVMDPDAVLLGRAGRRPLPARRARTSAEASGGTASSGAGDVALMEHDRLPASVLRVLSP